MTEGYQSIYRVLISSCPDNGIVLKAIGLLAWLHVHANSVSGIYSSNASILASETNTPASEISRLLEMLRGGGLVLYPSHSKPGLRAYFLPGYKLQSTPVRITRSLSELKSAAVTGRIPGIRKGPDCSKCLKSLRSTVGPTVGPTVGSCRFVEKQLSALIDHTTHAWRFSYLDVFSRDISTDPFGLNVQIINVSTICAVALTKGSTVGRTVAPTVGSTVALKGINKIIKNIDVEEKCS